MHLSTGSVNGKSDAIKKSKKEIFVELKIKTVDTQEAKGIPKDGPALILGRLKATHHKHNVIFSR